jgi:RNA polymerase sigma-70 factor (ECF subfamily)
LQDNTGRIEDHVLVARVVAGQDTGAFGELIRRHQSQVRNFLRRLSRDDTLADDLAQDCFLHAWDKIHTYSGRGSFIGWLMKIAYTTFLQSKRKSKRYGEILEQAGLESSMVSAGAGEDTLDLEKLLAAMDEQERVIMVFSYACGLSHREISEAMDLPAGTVKSIIHRTKEKIRSRFDIESYQHG